MGNLVPQELQNLAPSEFSALQLEHRIDIYSAASTAGEVQNPSRFALHGRRRTSHPEPFTLGMGWQLLAKSYKDFFISL